MKSKRWVRRNRRTRPEWVEEYNECERINRINWALYFSGHKLWYCYPILVYIVQDMWIVGHRYLEIKREK